MTPPLRWPTADTNTIGMYCCRLKQPFFPNWTSPTALLVAAAVAITIACVLLAVNFMGGEEKIQQRIERLNSLEAPRLMVTVINAAVPATLSTGDQRALGTAA